MIYEIEMFGLENATYSMYRLLNESVNENMIIPSLGEVVKNKTTNGIKIMYHSQTMKHF